MEREKIEKLIAKWREFADTDYTKGQKLGDARKQGQYELLMAGQLMAYATAAEELAQLLSELDAPAAPPTAGEEKS
jgi:hypothetical protein